MASEVVEDGRPAGPGVDRDSLYAGIGGLALVLAEISQCRALSNAEQALAAGIAARLSATAGWEGLTLSLSVGCRPGT